MLTDTVRDGIVIGAAGGAVAGLILWLVDRLREWELDYRHKRRIFNWLDKVTAPDEAVKWRSTRAIASYNDLTEDRVRYLCSQHEKIVLSTREREVWGVKGRARNKDQTGVVQGRAI